MKKEALEDFAREAAKGIKTEQELYDHIGYDNHEPSGNSSSRNGTSSKTLRSEDGQF